MTWPDYHIQPQNGWDIRDVKDYGVLLVKPGKTACMPGTALTVAQVAEIRGCTNQNVLHLIKTGVIPATKFSTLWQIRAADAIRVQPIKPKGQTQ
jgi:hypothetical protein